jgi:hypothetical protein
MVPGDDRDDSRRSLDGWWLSLAEMRRMRMAEPCESPIRMTGLPSSWARNHFKLESTPGRRG